MLGYYKAGEKLAALVICEERNQDILFFPICFNYRHYVELTLKHLIKSAEKYYFVLRELGPENVRSELNRSFLFPRKRRFRSFIPNTKTHARVLWKSNPKRNLRLTATHNLKILLQWLIDRLQLISNQKFDNNIRNIILELNKIDPKGQSFRYGLLTNDVFSMKYTKNYNLEEIYKNMKDVYSYLSGIDIFLTEETQDVMDDLYQIQEETRALENEALSESAKFDDYYYIS